MFIFNQIPEDLNLSPLRSKAEQTCPPLTCSALQYLYSTKSPGPDLSPLRSKAEQTCPPLTCSELHKCSYFSDETKPNLKCKPVHTSQFPQEKKNTVYTPLLGLPRACPAPQAHHWFSCSSVPARRQHSGCTEEAARAMAPSFLNVSTARGKASC